MKALIGSMVACIFFSVAGAQTDLRLEKYLDSTFKFYQDKPSPGIALTVLKSGKPVARKNYGMAVIEHQVPFTHQTVLRLPYSETREFLCVAAALMEKEGLLTLDDRVRKYFPELPAWSEAVTLQDLLNHSSGFDDEWGTLLLMQADMGNHIERQQLLDLLIRQPAPQVEPGKGYMYCNSDMGLLRLILEKASGRNLAGYMQEKIFKPLGMLATRLNDDPELLLPGLANTYAGRERFRRYDKMKTSPGSNYRIASSTDDLQLWALACTDTRSFVSAALQRLYKNARPIPVKEEKHYPFGHEEITRSGQKVIRHTGVVGFAYILRIPSQDICIIALSNNSHLQSSASAILDYYIPSLKQPSDFNTVYGRPAIPADSSVLKKYTGRYWSAQRSHSSHLKEMRYYDFKHENGKLLFYYEPDAFIPLIPIGPNLFKDPDYPNYFRFRQVHPDSVMQAEAVDPVSGTEYMERKGREGSGYEWNDPAWKKYTGLYYSKHLGYYFRLLLNDYNELIIRRPTVTDKVLVPYGDNEFVFYMESGIGSGWNVQLLFTMDKKGEPTGFVLRHVRMMHHRFERVGD